MTEFPSLGDSLAANKKLSEFVFRNYNSNYLDILECLFENLHCEFCRGLDTKIRETSPDPIRFQSLIAELEFATYFIRRKMRVELLSSNAFSGRKPPDMSVRSSSREYFVEVKNIQEDELEYILTNKIAEILNLRKMSFMFSISTSKGLSEQSFFFKRREEKAKLLRQALDEFASELQNIPIDSSQPITIKTSYADIELHKTTKGKSFLGTRSTDVVSEAPDYRDRILKDVTDKARKRERWVEEELNRLYLIAIADDSWMFYIDRYNMEFFGLSTSTYGVNEAPPTSENDKIKIALRCGWENYLKRMFILEDRGTVIPEDKRGFFFNDSIAANITAILVKHWKKFYLLANPFAEQRINYPQVLQEMSDSSIGWE